MAHEHLTANDRDALQDRPLLGWVRLWLALIALLIAAMVVVGGATRLTDSGLSITEWQPILGAIPPLNQADWQEAFDLYKQIPEYTVINKDMSLEEFKFIYWWEWGHRFLGRFVGLAFFVPLVIFWWRGALAGLQWKLLAIFVLGGAQGALGWYMVMSGLVDRVDVSQYRLAAHLSLAVALFGLVLWLFLDLGRRAGEHVRAAGGHAIAWAFTLAALIFLQIVLGAFVAGLDAGFGYNTWPLMDERWIPDGLFEMSPAWVNLFENTITVQFNHRMLAYVIVFLVVLNSFLLWQHDERGRFRATGTLLLLATLGQVALGIFTLLAQVPLWLGLAHQFVALVVFGAALWHLHAGLRVRG